MSFSNIQYCKEKNFTFQSLPDSNDSLFWDTGYIALRGQGKGAFYRFTLEGY